MPAVIGMKDPPIPEISELKQPDSVMDIEAETQWCQHVYDVIRVKHDHPSENDERNLNIFEHASWAAYHDSHQVENDSRTAISTLLPLFQDDSKSVAMIKHSMDVVKKSVNIFNPGQTPVIACDQPLFKIAKDFQWSWPLTHGEDSYVVMLGGLHIKMTLLTCLGDLLDGSGWTSAISHAQVASPGTADSFLKASHVKKTARAHQVTACALYNLRPDAYIKGGTETTREAWSLERRGSSVQFRLWELILITELAIMTWQYIYAT